MGFNCRAGTLEPAEAFQFIGDELVVGRVLQWQESFEECVHLGGPCATTGSAAWFRLVATLVAQEGVAQLVEPRAAHSEMAGGGSRIKASDVEVAKDPTDEFNGKAMDELFLFTPLK